MAKTRAFSCPTCGAPLDYGGGDEPTVRCSYCDASVIVPEELRPTKVQAYPSKITVVVPEDLPLPAAAPPGVARRSIAAILIAAAVCLAGIAGVAAFLLMSGKRSDSGVAKVPGRITLSFGGEGIGPGLFQDARHVAVDGQGNIYVGEYSDGRIQRFDPSGKFLGLWRVDRKKILTGFDVDRQGIAHVVLSGSGIHRYEAATGKFLDRIAYPEEYGFKDVQVTADGGLVAFWYSMHDDIVRFDAQNRVLFSIPHAISGQADEGETSARVASDGMGNIFVLGGVNNAVFQFSPEGKYLNRFGGPGSQPGQFSSLHDIAVDGQGRVYVSDWKGIQVFDNEGRYLDLIPVDGTGYGMAINDRNELFVVTGKKVLKYEVSLSGL